MPIQILAVGKQREPFYKEAAEKYLRRLKPYCKLSIREIKDEKDPGEGSHALSQKVLETEGERLLSAIAPQDVVVALYIEGEQLTSEAFSTHVKRWHEQTRSVVFVIGGSLGLSEAVIKRADLKLSFSPMTFPHQLARVMLLEQIYRAYKINAGERYHK